MALGKISKLAIKLGPPTETLYVAEGFEDAMTAQQASEGRSSAWAAAGSSNLPNLVVPDAVRTVVFLGQNDKNDPTQRDKTFEQNLAEEAAPKLLAEGKTVRVARPPTGIKDVNDHVKGKTGPALAEGYVDVQRMIDAAEDVAAAAGDEDAEEVVQGPQASMLVDLALKQSELFHDARGECYASFRAAHQGGAHRETHKIKSSGFRLWLLHAYYRNTSSAPNPTAMATAINTLEAHALFDGAEHKVFVRTASYADRSTLISVTTVGAQSKSILPAGASSMSRQCASAARRECSGCRSPHWAIPRKAC